MNKDTVKVIINEGGLTCMTLNPLKEPHYSLATSDYIKFLDLQEQYNAAEKDRITYDISEDCNCHRKHIVICYGCHEPGKIYRARIENGKAIIL